MFMTIGLLAKPAIYCLYKSYKIIHIGGFVLKVYTNNINRRCNKSGFFNILFIGYRQYYVKSSGKWGIDLQTGEKKGFGFFKRKEPGSRGLGDRLRYIKNNGLANTIVKKRHYVEMLFIVLIIWSVINAPLVKVNYDLTEYLPSYTESKMAIDLMEREFGYPGTARVMITDVSIYEAYLYKQRLENIDGVDMVTWMTEDVYMAQDFIDLDAQKDYYKDRCAVMDITFDQGDNDQLTKDAIAGIQDILGERGRFAGPAVENKSLEETLDKEIRIIMAVAVVLILVILCLTTDSWFEPVLFLTVMGIAILLNMGSNILLGTISFMSSSVASVLQLATSMDYSVFLLHTYVRRNEQKPGNKEKAMTGALKESAVSILSSAMTTFVGFMALLAMRFGLGRDVGLVLGKSILCSVATVLFLMPALLLRFGDLIEKTKHKSIMPKFELISRAVFKLRYLVMALMVVVVVPAYVAQNMNSFTFGNSALGRSEGTKVYDDTAEIEAKFGRSNLYLILVPNESPIKERELADELEDLYYVKSVMGIANVLPVGIPENFVPESIRGQLRTENYARMLMYTKTDTESELAFQTSDEIQEIVKTYYPENAYVVGNTPSTQDLKELMVPDYAVTNVISLLAVAVVVGLAFKSLLLPILVLIPITIATYMNMTVPYLQGESFMFNGFIIVSCIQLGATVDYSILLTNNYMYNREHGLEKKPAAIDALQRSILSILTSGTILTVAGYGIFFISSVSAISSLGHLIGRGGLISMCMVILAVPALLTAFDGIIFREKEVRDRLKQKEVERLRKKVQLRRAQRREWMQRLADRRMEWKAKRERPAPEAGREEIKPETENQKKPTVRKLKNSGAAGTHEKDKGGEKDV